MKHLWLTCSVLAGTFLGTWSSFGAGVNFKISTMEDPNAEGPGVTRTFISVGPRPIAMRLPQHAQITSQADNITVFVSEKGASGQFTISNSPFSPGQDFAAKLEDYFQAAKANLPKEAENIDIKGGDPNIYTNNDWKSQAFEVTYSLFAHPTHRQMAYINLDNEHQVYLDIISDEDSWKTTYAIARRFLKSWFWLDDLKVARTTAAAPKATAAAAPAQ